MKRRSLFSLDYIIPFLQRIHSRLVNQVRIILNLISIQLERIFIEWWQNGVTVTDIYAYSDMSLKNRPS